MKQGTTSQTNNSCPLTLSAAVPSRSCALRVAGLHCQCGLLGCLIYEVFLSTAPHPIKKVCSPGDSLIKEHCTNTTSCGMLIVSVSRRESARKESLFSGERN